MELWLALKQNWPKKNDVKSWQAFLDDIEWWQASNDIKLNNHMVNNHMELWLAFTVNDSAHLAFLIISSGWTNNHVEVVRLASFCDSES